ncbi:lysophospholipase [Geosmithia morbida]|uniref:Lysophospholipase n=1 Tax=Geosmithia morbida TaxID=1094350 RepID=A0A9P4YUH1_9HYPO|nr:lysophospholipase [Geosmithia morbida]KAF4121916.1 lysophospholipase [Geosmithia morbida]
MKSLPILLTASAVAGATASSFSDKHAERAVSNAPDGYVPTAVDCPDDRPTIRNGTSLSQKEKEWLLKRRNETITPIRDFLKRVNIADFNSTAYLSSVEEDATALPNIGLAFSGGGYRAMLTGAGAFAALDDRSPGSQTTGNLGGLVQSATYISGLSGGGWLVGSLYVNNFTTVEDSLSNGAVWELQDSILEGPEQYALYDYYSSIFDDVSDKEDAGFQRSVTDYWGRMLSYQLVNASHGGPGVTFSSIAEDSDFSAGKAPMPFLVAVGRQPGQQIVSINSTVFDFNPWELGSFDPTLRGFVPLEWVGSNFTDGEIPDDGQCVRGFDNAGFVMGTSSSLFNQIVLYLNNKDSGYVPDDVPDFVVSAITDVLEYFGNDNDDIADWTPNPFQGWNEAENYDANLTRLTLVDGGEDSQNIPFHPHLFGERAVDVILAFDNSADTELGWPQGISAVATYERSLDEISEGTGFPVVPGKDTFVNLGLNARPTFFGCDSSNTSVASPLIVYIPNYPYVYNSNTSTFQTSYNETEQDAMVQNGWAVATQLNATRDEQWPVCVGCAILSRSFDRTNTTVPQACEDCFNSYCWNGTIDESEPATYAPSIYGDAVNVQEGAASALEGQSSVALVVAGLAASAIIMGL